MNKPWEQKFQQALEICQSLISFKLKASNLPREAIQLFCEIAKEPFELLNLCKQYDSEIEPALKAIADYAARVDNWKHGDCPFAVKDRCNILHFFLNLLNRFFAELTVEQASCLFYGKSRHQTR